MTDCPFDSSKYDVSIGWQRDLLGDGWHIGLFPIAFTFIWLIAIFGGTFKIIEF